MQILKIQACAQKLKTNENFNFIYIKKVVHFVQPFLYNNFVF